MSTPSTLQIAKPLSFALSINGLVVCERARRLFRKVAGIAKPFPLEEDVVLANQRQGAVLRIGPLIAESWAKRRYYCYSLGKLTDAYGGQMETQHRVIAASNDGCILRGEAQRLSLPCVGFDRPLGDLMQHAESSYGNKCGVLKETPASYFLDQLPGNPLNTKN